MRNARTHVAATVGSGEREQGKAPAQETPSHGYVITKPVKGSDIPADYTFVLTRDEIYVPIAVRKPKGDGPFGPRGRLERGGNGCTSRLNSDVSAQIARKIRGMT